MRDAREVMAEEIDEWFAPVDGSDDVANAVLIALHEAGYELHPVGTGETLADGESEMHPIGTKRALKRFHRLAEAAMQERIRPYGLIQLALESITQDDMDIAEGSADGR